MSFDERYMLENTQPRLSFLANQRLLYPLGLPHQLCKMLACGSCRPASLMQSAMSRKLCSYRVAGIHPKHPTSQPTARACDRRAQWRDATCFCSQCLVRLGRSHRVGPATANSVAGRAHKTIYGRAGPTLARTSLF